ncbi:MAG: hypothetical protein U9R08_05150 [Nanoarchaeota archaeon]|nr:hypothetical protein [Nanoarchaeota archaeon]
MQVSEVYERLDDLEDKLRFDLRKAFTPEQEFQAHADFSREYLLAMGKEVPYQLIEKSVREALIMDEVWLKLDKVKFSYNNLVRELTTIRRDAIAKSLVTGDGPDDVHSLTQVFEKYEINPVQDTFTKAVYLISQTRKDVIQTKYGHKILRMKELLTPNHMTFSEFILFKNGYATSTFNGGVDSNVA